MIYCSRKKEVNFVLKKKEMKEYGLRSVLNYTAVRFASRAANTACMCLYHQPKMPKEVEKLIKNVEKE